MSDKVPAFTYHVMSRDYGFWQATMIACTAWVSIEGLERLGWRTVHICHGWADAMATKERLEDAAVGIGHVGMVAP